MRERARNHPRPGIDYPRTLGEFDTWFPDDAACLAYLAGVRWRDGFVCPRCGNAGAWRMSDGLLRCTVCRARTSPTAGTIFARTRTPLRAWFHAAWYVTNQKHGVSALGLQRVLGLGSYETAWAWLHKLRRAMVRPGRDRLTGEVELDETYVGAPAQGKRGRGAGKKAIVGIAVEKRGQRMGRVRLARIPDISGASLEGFAADALDPEAVVFTDHYHGYDGFAAAGYRHLPTAIADSGDPAHVVMPRVHLVASLLKRWLLGTHQGAVRPQHLDYYLDEFAFRFNRRNSNHRGLLFYRLLEQAVELPPSPLASIVGGKPSVAKNKGQ